LHNKFLILEFFEKKIVFKKIDFLSDILNKNPDPRQKIDFYFLTIFFQKVPKLKIYYAKWTLRIDVLNGKKLFVIVFSEFI
jgi:hypothetical protein